MPQVIKVSDSPDLVPTAKYKYGKWPFADFNPVQSRLFDIFEGNSNVAIAAATSAGKAQPLSVNILTPNGFVKMGDIKIGDLVISSKGLPIKVTGVFPQGKKSIFKVVFSDGASTFCCEDHLWSVRTKSDKCKKKGWKVFSLKDLRKNLKDSKGFNKWQIPLLDLHAGLQNKDWNNDFSNLPLHPYVLGAILGDGGICHSVIFTSADEEIINKLKNLLPENVCVEHIEKYDYKIVRGMNQKVPNTGFLKTNLVKDILFNLGLFGLNSCEKFIPKMYLESNPCARLELLRGLMDTDGAANRTKAAEFTSCSPKLAQDFCQLVKSLGGASKVRINKSGYKGKNGEYIECQKRHRVTVNLGEINPFSLTRKVNNQQVGLEKGRNRYINEITYFGEEECQCISVDSLDHLYVTDDYILTHNTVSAEMYLAYEIRKRGGKGIYVGPLKALAKEKEMDWTDPTHHFSDLKTFIATGDFRFTAKRIKEMEDSSLIVLTPEMLASRCRNHSSDKSKFLYDVGTVVFDESHLLTVPSRGDHIEVALMKLTEINPNVRIVFLSATMPNVDEICGWISNITNRDTYYLESDYRPCPLNIHYETYYDGDRQYDDRETAKVGVACAIVEHYSDDKFLIFVHTKRTGQLMVESMLRYGVKAEFHNADLGLKDRMNLEERFKNDKTFRVLVATSTLAWGLNLPARRVIVTGVHRGIHEVENYDIQQMIGRAGRPKYDPRGDAYILIPESNKDAWIKKLKTKAPIRSTLLDFVGKAENPHYKTLAFHVVAEIHQGNIKTKEAFKTWFKSSLAHFQDHAFDDEVIERTLKSLEDCRAIVINDKGEYECTAVGKVASMFYYSPFDVSDLRRNFKKLFDEKKQDDDFAVSLALGNLDSYRFSIINRQEKDAVTGYRLQIEKMYGVTSVTDSIHKIGCAYFNMLRGKRDVPALQATTGTLIVDLDRTLQVLSSLDSMSGKWSKQEWFKTLGLRLRYGVQADLVELCQIPNVGAVRAKKLKSSRIKTLNDFVQYDPDTLAKVMNCSLKLAQEALDGARSIQLKESIL